ncbi:MAG: TonB-dependent siderophore receptor [Rhodospirillaceae bacterium]|nr:TonB-dependent siderophore receptor [Rhodospirillaceae bacterium]
MSVSATAFAQSADQKILQLPPVTVEDTALGFSLTKPTDKGYKATRSLSATKTDTPLIDVPQAVTVVTEKQIVDQAANSVGDAIRYVPGVTSAQGEGNRETLVLRGNTTTGDFFVDGIRDDVQTYRDLYNIQQLEVFKGPNAMIFGRGGIGGVINRVTKQADWANVRELRLEGGSYNHARGQFDVGQAVNDAVALRLTGVYQYSESYRDDVFFRRWGVNPTASFRLGDDTLVQVGYEHFYDRRVADRGVPGHFRPSTATGPVEALDTPRGQFFGDPKNSPTWTNSDAVNIAIEHRFSDTMTLRNRTRYADYDKFYQNIFPGAVNAAEATVSISGYNNGQKRKNLINQTDFNATFNTGSIKHTVLAGMELGRQKTDNVRTTAYFGPNTSAPTTLTVPISASNIRTSPTWAPNATDASNHGVATVAAGYIQDQITIIPQVQIIAGLRYDSFNVDFLNNRTAARLDVTDKVWSPRAGLIYKPAENVSVYAAFSRTFQPRAGEQLASLSATTASLAPEEFTNYEIGAKWDVLLDFNVAAALYQLDRDNVIVLIDPNNPALGTELGGGQRTKGIEMSATGNITDQWSVIASYAYQDGKFTKAISASVREGATLANLPKHSISVWSRYDVTSDLGIGLGMNYQSKRYAAQDNLQVMRGFARFDAAVFYNVTENITAQVNVENLFDKKYFVYANSNNNITPGSPTAFKAALTARF